MNAHTIAWRMLHTELRRRIGGDDKEVTRFTALYQQARAGGVADLDIMCELAGFAAWFAQMTRDPAGVAQQVSREGREMDELTVRTYGEDGGDDAGIAITMRAEMCAVLEDEARRGVTVEQYLFDVIAQAFARLDDGLQEARFRRAEDDLAAINDLPDDMPWAEARRELQARNDAERDD